MTGWQRLLAVLMLCQPACQAGLPTTTPAVSASKQRDAGEPDQLVLALLADLPRSEPVLGALTADERARFDRLLEALSDAELEVLRASDGPLAYERPLLHLMAGGRSQAALYALATTPSASSELAATSGSPDNLGRVLETTNEVILRAANEWLRLAQQRLEQGPSVDPTFCDELDRVALVLENYELRYAVRRLWLTLDASVAARLNLARSALWTRRPEEARDLYQSVLKEPALSADEQRFAKQIGELITGAEQLSKPPRTLDEALLRANTYLSLTDRAGAARVLEKYQGEANSHLGLATSALIVKFPDLPCTGVRAGLGDTRLCAFAMQRGPLASPAFANLDAAWRSGRGRSSQSVQDYLGLKVIVPWKLSAADPTLKPSAVDQGLALATLSEQVTDVAPEFSALALFGRALALGASASGDKSQSEAPELREKQRQDLSAKLEQLLKSTQRSHTHNAAALAAITVLSQQTDVRELYRSLYDPIGTRQALSQVALGAWLAAAFADAALFELVKARAITVLGELDQSSLQSSALVLLLTEAANVVQPSADNQHTLEQVSRELTRPNVPARLQLRSALHLAHLAGVRGQSEGVSSTLREVLAAPNRPLVTPEEVVLTTLVRARLFLAEQQADMSSERLEQWRELFRGASHPPSVTCFWRAWEAEFGYRLRLAQCGKNARCAGDAERERALALAAQRRALAAVPARLLDRDVLSLGSLEMTLDYQPRAGLRAIVDSDPALIFLPLPAAL